MQIEMKKEPEVQAKKNNKGKVVVASAACVALLAGAGTVAFLTAKDEKENKFNMTTDGVNITVNEGNWNNENNENVLPMQALSKEPAVDNNGQVEIYAALEVKIPLHSSAAGTPDFVDSTGHLIEVQNKPYFLLGTCDKKETDEGAGKIGSAVQGTFEQKFGETDGTITAGYADNWKLNKAEQKDGNLVLTYLYKNTVQPGNSTGPLFDAVQFQNFDAKANITSGSIIVTGYAVQAQGFENVDQAWEAYQAQGSGAVTETQQ